MSKQQSELQECALDLVLRILQRGRLNQQEIEGKLLVRDMGINVRKEQFANEIVQLVEAQLDEREANLKKLYNFDQNHHDALKGIDNYDKFSKGKPDSPERLAAFIHQLSPWNLERGVEALREWSVKVEKSAVIDEYVAKGIEIRKHEISTAPTREDKR